MANLSKVNSSMIDGKIAVNAIVANGVVTITFNDGTSVSFSGNAVGSGGKTVANVSLGTNALLITYTDGTTSTLSMSGVGGGGGSNGSATGLKDVKSSRLAGTTYTNDSGTLRFIVVQTSGSSTLANQILYVDGRIISNQNADPNTTVVMSCIIPPGSTYKIVLGGTAVISYWNEIDLGIPTTIGGIGATAWLDFNGLSGSTAIKAGSGIASIERIALGKYRVTFSTPMDNTNYCVMGNNTANMAGVGSALWASGGPTTAASEKTLTTCVVVFGNGDTNSDVQDGMLLFFGGRNSLASSGSSGGSGSAGPTGPTGPVGPTGPAGSSSVSTEAVGSYIIVLSASMAALNSNLSAVYKNTSILSLGIQYSTSGSSGQKIAGTWACRGAASAVASDYSGAVYALLAQRIA